MTGTYRTVTYIKTCNFLSIVTKAINPAVGCHYFLPPGSGGTGVRGLTRGLATLPLRCIQEPLTVRDMDESERDLRETPGLAVDCFSVCSGSALLGDSWGKQIRGKWLSLLLIYSRIFKCIICSVSYILLSYYVYVFSLCFCVLVLVKLSVLAKWLARKTSIIYIIYI